MVQVTDLLDNGELIVNVIQRLKLLPLPDQLSPELNKRFAFAKFTDGLTSEDNCNTNIVSP